MPIKLNPYLNFDAKAREAMTFYKDVFGGTLTMSTYKDAGLSHGPEDDGKIMHSALVTENGLTLMASDAPKDWPLGSGGNVSLSLSGEDEAKLKGYWEKLSVDAKVEQPLALAPWGDQFGMLTDKFGTRWMINIIGKKAS